MPKVQKSAEANEFAAWEVSLAKGKAHGLIGKYGFTRDDLPDLEQELFLEIHLKRGAGSGWHQHTATARTITSRILDNRIHNIIESACANKRRVHLGMSSLNTVIAVGDDDEPITLADCIGEDYRILNRRLPENSNPQDFHIDLELKKHAFSDIQRQIIALVMQGCTMVEIAERVGRHRVTIIREIMRLRGIFTREGLSTYN